MAKRKSTKKTPKISNQNKNPKQNQNHNVPLQAEKPASWAVIRSLFTCKHQQQIQENLKEPQPQQQKQQHKQHQKHKQQQQQIVEEKQENPKQPQPLQQQQQQQQQQQKQKQKQEQEEQQPSEPSNKKIKKMNCSGSLCNNTKVMQRPEASSSSSPENHKKMRAFCNNITIDGSTSSKSLKTPLKKFNGPVVNVSSSSSAMSVSNSGYSPLRSIPFRKLSGCYECRMVVDPVLGFTKDPSLRATMFSCPQCGDIFMKPEKLELHQSVRHAVSELGPEDTSKNIVEIIFQSSWLRKHSPVCTIHRILKIQNTPKTITNFETYRDAIKTKALALPKKHPRCIADGNELLRFHCTTFHCSLGLNGSSNLCNSISLCGVCSIIKNGFRVGGGKGILTTATSGKAHDDAAVGAEENEGRRAMLVCRVIAGRVRKEGQGVEGEGEEYDSVAGDDEGVYANFDELYVGNPRAILPCFVVIYGGFQFS